MLFLVMLLILRAVGLKAPGTCNSDQFYDSSQTDCRYCNTNYSMVPAADGFGCTCASNSIRLNLTRCKPCDSTELISEDGATCVPRRCQKSGGRVVCRKCPNDYIAVTQNFDGSPMKEVTCFKCTRGYKAKNNKCVKCESCTCNKNEIVVSGKCLSKKYVIERPKYSDNKLHPTVLLDVVKLEYLCSLSDLRLCHALATECVKYFYTSDLAGPCRLWLNRNVSSSIDLPKLTLNASTKNNEADIKRGQDKIKIAIAEYYSTGAVKFLEDERRNIFNCLPPIVVKLGEDFSHDCITNVSDLIPKEFGKTYEVYLPNEHFKALPISILQADSRFVQKGSWPSKKFRRFFLIDSFLSTNINMSTTIYLRKLLFNLRVERTESGSLGLHISTEVQYATKSPMSQHIITTIIVKHEIASAGVLWGLQVWGVTLAVLLSIYGLVQWHTAVRRGGLQFCILPILAGSIADGLYFATLFSTLHALAAEAGTLGITLPLSQAEDNVISAVIIAVVVLKMARVVWMNVKQCLCDIFFLDWTEYYPTVQDGEKSKSNYFWRSVLLAREWIGIQTVRRVSPLATVIITVILLQILEPWQRYFPQSRGYSWVIGSIIYWTSYVLLFSIQWIKNRMFGAPTARLAKICSGIQLSLLVFQEEYYAHYVHGRIEENGGSIKIPGPLASCRVACAPQIRIVYKQLANVENVFSDNESNRVLLSRFLAAFFERALDGLNWVAIERTTIERLFDAEFSNRENNTSRLLYDLESTTPSCFIVTWWGEEWTLATFDAMLFGAILLMTGHTLMAALITLIVWQIMKQFRETFSYRNLQNKTNIEVV